jgi:hypothetical protein
MRLKGTDFYASGLFPGPYDNFKIIWGVLKCSSGWLDRDPKRKEVSFEEVLDSVPDDIGIELLFHLDLFLNVFKYNRYIDDD